MDKDTIDMAFRAALQKEIDRRGRGTKARLAKELDITPTYVGDLLKAKSYGSENVRRRIAGYFGFAYEDFLAYGRGETSACKASQSGPTVILASHLDHAPEIKLENYFAAPLISGSIAAGSGRALSETDIESYVWIYGPELKERMQHDLISVRVDRHSGESMQPTLKPGDIVLVDKGDPNGDSKAFMNGAIYAIRDGKGGTCIKRLYRDKKGIIISSDNLEFAPEIAWTGNILELIIGRAVWGWRNLLDVK